MKLKKRLLEYSQECQNRIPLLLSADVLMTSSPTSWILVTACTGRGHSLGQLRGPDSSCLLIWFTIQTKLARRAPACHGQSPYTCYPCTHTVNPPHSPSQGSALVSLASFSSQALILSHYVPVVTQEAGTVIHTCTGKETKTWRAPHQGSHMLGTW